MQVIPSSSNEKERQQSGISDSCGCLWMHLTDLREPEGSSRDMMVHRFLPKKLDSKIFLMVCSIYVSGEENMGLDIMDRQQCTLGTYSQIARNWVDSVQHMSCVVHPPHGTVNKRSYKWFCYCWEGLSRRFNTQVWR
ncbi:uncharacterized protein LOC141690331 isoform X2 [Apium graveolens]|uniref:uncharacterized protein LOC141690331 isoform X2 n=1 Tax=Apium graveolens TaxID=4045 RepID=UPI003D790BC9